MDQEKKQFNLPPELEGKKFRIRKLTPRECFRLMGVDDADIDKIQTAGISNSSQYKLAGNSIVVDNLYHIFRKMFIDRKPDSERYKQLSLFGDTGGDDVIEYTKDHPLRVVTLCSGYDSNAWHWSASSATTRNSTTRSSPGASSIPNQSDRWNSSQQSSPIMTCSRNGQTATWAT